MPTNRKVQRAVRLALGIGAGSLTFGASTGALAQVEGEQVLEEVVVTGTRISRPDLDSASPISVVDREAILAYGVTDVGNLIVVVQIKPTRIRRIIRSRLRPGWSHYFVFADRRRPADATAVG